MDPQSLQVHEDCVGLYASTIAKLILDLLVQFNLPLKNCRGQCYDGAINMAGQRAGVATKIKQVELRALYIHCMGHSFTGAEKLISQKLYLNLSLEIMNVLNCLVHHELVIL